MTAELDLDDLGIDVSDIRELPQDLGESASVEPVDLTIEQPGVDAEEDDLLSATGVTEVLRDDMDLDQTGTVALDNDEPFDDDSLGIRTEVLEQAGVAFEADASDGNDDNLDLNLDDFSSALEGGATAEQPGLSGYGVDLDVGDDIPGDDEPTGTEDIGPLDPQTMTEVGTKLDLARAYIDMGDPEGAKSILEEVMTEGDSGQRSEAQALMNALPA
jgi:pilus assembly protein FimV